MCAGPGLGLSPKPDITGYGNQCPVNCAVNDNGCSGPDTVSIWAPQWNTPAAYRSFGGTSAASPMVAGACALIIDRNPAITPAAVKKLLMDNAEDKGAMGWDTTWGAGLTDLGPIFQAAPPPCDLRVYSVAYSPTKVQCYKPVTITVVVENVGAVPVTDFSVDWERWYFGPNQPVQRLPIGAGPTANTAGALTVGAQRSFQRTWTPGTSDSLPLSKHTCFWGIVHAACDTNASNNELYRNADIIGVTNKYMCKSKASDSGQRLEGDGSCSGNGAPCEDDGDCFEGACAGVGPACHVDDDCGVGISCVGGETCEFAPVRLVEYMFRVAHNEPGAQNIRLLLENPDPDNWLADLKVGEEVGEELFVYIDNESNCPVVWATVRADPIEPEFTPPLVELTVRAFDDEEVQIGEMQVLVDINEPIPTVSEWGVVVMVLLVLAAGTIVFRKLRAAAA